MSVSEPGTATIFTQVVVLCLLNVSTMFFSLSVAGGGCDVQKRACLVPELHPGSGAPEVCPPGAHATPTTRKAISEAVTPRPGSNDMAVPPSNTWSRAFFPSANCLPGRERAGAGPPDHSTSHYCGVARRCQLGRWAVDLSRAFSRALRRGESASAATHQHA